MICPNCSQFVSDGSRFCTNCGTKLLDSVIQEEQQAVPEQPDTGFQATAPEQPDTGFQATASEQPDTGFQATAPEQPTGGFQQETPGQQVAPEQQPGGFQATPGYTGGQTYGEFQQAAPVGETVVKKGVSKPVIFGIIGGGVFLLAAVITLIIVFLVMGGKTKYNLQDYTTVEFSGVEGSGKADVSIDAGELAKAIAKNNGMDADKYSKENIDFDDIANFFSGENLGELMKLYSAIETIDVKVDKPEGLSNGDTLTVSYNFDPEKAKEVKAEFIGEPYTVTVSGLEEIQEIDPFEDLEIHFEGTSPNAYITVQNKATLNEAMNYVWFETDKYDGYKLGDTVTIRVEGYDEASFISLYGVKFSQTEKDYTVEGVEAYITENAPLDEAALSAMKQASEGYISEYFEDTGRAEYISASDVNYEGYYLLTNKADQVWYGYNKIYMIFSVNVKSIESKKQFKPTKVYMPIEYTDLKKNANGSYDIDTTYKMILGSTDLKFGFWQTVSGYTDQETMKSELIDAEAATYDGKVYGDGLAG